VGQNAIYRPKNGEKNPEGIAVEEHGRVFKRMIDEKPNKLCGKWALVELGVCIEGEVAGIHFLEFDGRRE
jgi:hypothetical protein